MRVEVCDIGGDFETRFAKIFVELVVARAASPFENVIDALADERVEVLRVESILQLTFLDETLHLNSVSEIDDHKFLFNGAKK